MESLVSQSDPRRTSTVAANDMITCLHPLAAAAARETLDTGGNAVDAAVVAAFVLGVVEPMMSGIGGGGVMVVQPRGEAPVVIDHSPRAPASATPDMFPLVGEGTAGFYGWPAVADDANIVGPRAVAVPGTVAGLSMALQRWGTRSLAQSLQPAIRLAEDGFPIDWFTATAIGIDLDSLRLFPETAAIFLPNGVPPRPVINGQADLLVQPDLARTLRHLAEHGADSFYQGQFAAQLIAGLGDDAILSADDLAAYQPRVYEGEQTLLGHYRDLTMHGTPFEGGAITTATILNLLDRHDLGAFGPGSGAAYHLIAEASRRAFTDRFSLLADHAQADVPWDRFRSASYLDEQAAEFSALPGPTKAAMGHPSSAASAPNGHTTHLCVVDRERTVVSLTQTVLDFFGSRVVPTGTGVVLNNGMMWFDPRPGQINSVASGKWALTAMSPLILCRDGRATLAVGASGGRRILTSVAQVVSNVVDHGLAPQAAVQVPRVHLETETTEIDERATPSAIAALRRRGHNLNVVSETPLSAHFALPNAIAIGKDGLLRGGVDPIKPGIASGG